MKGLWWKLLATLLLLYTAIIGLRTPLGPAIVQTSVSRIAPGPLELDVWGYGTHFNSDQPRAWLVNDSQRVCASNITAIAGDHMKVFFDVPAGLRKQMTDLQVFNGTDGLVTRYAAFYTDSLGGGIAEHPCVGGKSLELAYTFPNRDILNESIRNLFFHVPMWFTMVTLMAIGVWKSIRALRTNSLDEARAAASAVGTGLVFGVLGLISGSLWARVTWETWWTTDPKLNGAAAGVLIYLAYLVLRGSVPEPAKRARLSAIYSIFAFAFMLLFFFVLPRLNDSLHPGNGGNPAFNTYDLDNRLRSVFYPACLGWILLGIWMYQLRDPPLRCERSIGH